MLELTEVRTKAFHADGFTLLDRIIEKDQVEILRKSFDRIFSGEFETGTRPDIQPLRSS